MRTRSSAKQTRSESFTQMLDEQKELVMPELEEVNQQKDRSFLRSLYRHLASDPSIDDFLKRSRFYSITQRRWKLPRSHSKLLDSDTYTPFRNIISSIVKHFWRDAAFEGSRQIVDTHATDLQHGDSDPSSHTSRPSLVVKAEGPSFQLPSTPARPGEVPAVLGYSNIAGCIEIRGDADELSLPEQLIRTAIYARQLFIHQPNRRFARVLVLTGHHLRLFHFDRSGVQYTAPLDIHDDPHTFVRLILGLSSPNEADIGLDISIQWRIENGRKVSGFLKTRGVDTRETVYPLTCITPFFRRSNILGRCTTCWRVVNPSSGEELVVKDSWRLSDRIPEHIYLQEAANIPGVVEMLSCEPHRGQTKDLRGFGKRLPVDFQNRIETRVVLKCYGPAVTNFSSAKQVLCVLRDAIAGHRALLRKGMMHRDVSIKNILNGKHRAELGNRGILIDLDMAARYNAGGVGPVVDLQIGTFLYQSVMVLSSDEMTVSIPHDHLDDLESFLYVLTHIIHVYDQHGVFHSVADILKIWNRYDGEAAASLKVAFLSHRTIHWTIASRWPDAFIEVLYRFREFLNRFVHQKLGILDERPKDSQEILERLRLCAEDHYKHVLQIFDDGIAALEKDVAEQTSTTPPLNSPLLPHTSTQRSPLKRSSDDYLDAPPASKRLKSPKNGHPSPTPRTQSHSA